MTEIPVPTPSAEKMQQSALAADLVLLASERTSEKRVELLRRITDAYIEQADRWTSAEQYLFNEVVTTLIDKIAGAERAAASAKLAKLPKLTDGLAQKLASDSDIEVARPIIRDYAGLSERILIDVAKTGSQAHLGVIAGRPVVTPPVSDIVVTRGGSKTVRTLAANQGAQFSTAGMDKLIAKAEADSDLQTLIVERSDLSLVAIGKLLPLISDELSNRLRGVAVEVDESIVREHLAAWTENRQKNVKRTDAYIDGIRNGDLNRNDVVYELVTSKRLLDAATVLAAIVGLDRDYTFNLLTYGQIHSALLLLKAANLSWPTADGFLNLRIAKMGLPDVEKLPDRRDYVAIDAATAQRVVRFMKVRRAAAAN